MKHELTFSPCEWGMAMTVVAARKAIKKVTKYNPSRLYQGESKLRKSEGAENSRRQHAEARR